jgi:integrase/recombinase XerD
VWWGKIRYKEKVYRMVKKYGAKLDLGAFTPHFFRHAFATHNYDNGHGKPFQDISKWLGHSSIRTTEIYIHGNPNSEPIN